MVEVASTFHSAAEIRRAMLDKLAESGLNGQDAKLLRLQPLLANQVAERNFTVARAGFLIPYWTLARQPSDFNRIRYLEYGEASGFGALADRKSTRLNSSH